MSGIYRSGRNQFSLAVALFLPAAQAAVGDITTVVGSAGGAGDGGAATAASLSNPTGEIIYPSTNKLTAPGCKLPIGPCP